MRRFLLILCALLWASTAHAGDTLERGPAPDWVKAVPAAAAGTQPAAGDAFRVELFDQQFRFDDAGWHTYIHARTAILSPQALSALGTVSLPWNPAAQDVTVHSLEVIRGEERIDALEGRTFTVLRREANLEVAVVDGVLTGTLQLDDLRVGDRIEFAYSVTTRIPVLGPHAEFIASSAIPAVVDQYFLRGSWPTAIGMRLRASDDWTVPPVRRRGGRSEFELALDGLEPILVPPDAPARFHVVRFLEGSDYASWAELAAVFAPLYAEASVLADDSPLRAKAAHIRATHAAQADQVLAALRLVQDEVRYLALAMGEGGLVPATADETWNRRLGDCKAKTVLLMALLEELGVEARPVLASSVNDALDGYLPTVSAFDHVFVQATVDGQLVWLDGTRSGDRSLVALPPLDYGWVLPVEAAGATLMRLPTGTPDQPLRETTVEIDLADGLYSPAPVTGEILVRGDSAVVTQAQFSVISPAQREAYMRATWPALLDKVEVREVGSVYDPERNELRWTMTGEITLDWASRGGRRVEIPISRISWSAGERRAEGPFRDLPVTTNYPAYSRFRTTILLPDDGEGFVVEAADIDEEQAAYHHRRHVTRDGRRVTMERETVSLRPEMTEAERAAAVEPLGRLSRQVAEIVAPTAYETTARDLDALEGGEPDTAIGWLNKGLALSRNNRPEEAMAALDHAVEMDPTNANVRANRGILRFWRGDLEAAAEDFEQASELDPGDNIAMNGRGLLALEDGRYLDAIVEFSMSLRSNPDDPFILGVRSQAYVEMEAWDKALADVERIKELSPDWEVGVQQAAILLAAGRLDAAAAAADRAVEREPDNIEAMRMQAEVRERRGDLVGAVAALGAALALEPDHPQLLLERADLRFKLGEFDGARADLAVVRPMAKESAGLLNNLCWTQAVAGVDLQQALADCDAALVLAPTRAGILDSRAMVLLRLDRPADAVAVYDQALALEPEQAASLYGRGLARLVLGLTDEARADKAAAVRLDEHVAESFQTYEARLP